MKPSASLAAAALVLSACTGAGGWTRSDTAPEVAAQELAECRSEAQAVYKRDSDIDADILATRSRDWQLTGSLNIKKANFAAETEKQSDAQVNTCMISKGFAPGGAPQKK